MPQNQDAADSGGDRQVVIRHAVARPLAGPDAEDAIVAGQLSFRQTPVPKGASDWNGLGMALFMMARVDVSLEYIRQNARRVPILQRGTFTILSLAVSDETRRFLRAIDGQRSLEGLCLMLGIEPDSLNADVYCLAQLGCLRFRDSVAEWTDPVYSKVSDLML